MRLNLYSACLVAVFASEASALQLSKIAADDEDLTLASLDSMSDINGDSNNGVPCDGCPSSRGSTLAQGGQATPVADVVHNSDNFAIDGSSQHVKRNYHN